MKVIIEQDELHPFYTLTDDYERFNGKVAVISDEFHQHYKEVMDNFWKVQRVLREAVLAKVGTNLVLEE